MTTAGQDVESRFNRALASGAVAAAPAEPGFQQTDLRHVDQLRGRPFFEVVEQAAERHARDRPMTWYRPNPEDIRTAQARTHENAQELCAEIQETHPAASVHLLSAEDRLEAYLRDAQPNLVSRLAGAAQSDIPGASWPELSDHAAGMVYALDAVTYNSPSAFSRSVAGDDGERAGSIHLALTPARTLDPRVERSYDMGYALEAQIGVIPRAGHGPDIDPMHDVAYSNDHEIGHLLDAATTTEAARNTDDHDTYRSECYADAFAVLVEARRGGDYTARAAAIAEDRDVGAVLFGDAVHWTSPVAQAAAERVRDGTYTPDALAGMPLDDVMSAARRTADDNLLDRPGFEAFERTLDNHKTGERPDPTTDAAGLAAADRAFRGYARARIAGARGTALEAPDRSWEESAGAAFPRSRALSIMGDRASLVELHADQLMREAGNPGSTPSTISDSASALAKATDRMLASDEKLAADLDGPGHRRDQVHRRNEIAPLIPRAERIERAPNREAALEAAGTLCERLALGVAQASPYMEQAQQTLLRTSQSLENTVLATRTPEPARAPNAPARQAGEDIPF